MTTLRGLPSLTSVSATLYGVGAVLLVSGAITWVPGKNPRWVIEILAVVATAFVIYTLARGRRFTTSEALVMVTAELVLVGALTWTTDLTLGAFANGTALPVAGVYIIWFLHPVAGRVILYLGCLWWFIAILHHDDPSLRSFAASLLLQTIVAAEVFARLKGRLERQARTDQLTGTLNRRGIAELLEMELLRATKRRQDLSIVAIDLDGLRTVNNTQGHTAGDRLLEMATGHWRSGLRRRDAVGRTGGDEFLIILPGTTIGQADQIVAKLAVNSPGAWSAGVAMAKPGDTAEALLERADQRMYREKAARQRIDVPTTGNGPTVQS